MKQTCVNTRIMGSIGLKGDVLEREFVYAKSQGSSFPIITISVEEPEPEARPFKREPVTDQELVKEIYKWLPGARPFLEGAGARSQ